MKKISEVEEKPLKSSLRKDGGGQSIDSPLTLLPSRSADISLKDDVTVILILGAFLHGIAQHIRIIFCMRPSL
jgi:hypothetical protein